MTDSGGPKSDSRGHMTVGLCSDSLAPHNNALPNLLYSGKKKNPSIRFTCFFPSNCHYNCICML